MSREVIVREYPHAISVIEFDNDYYTEYSRQGWNPSNDILTKEEAIKLIESGIATHVKFISLLKMEEYRYDLINDIKLYKITRTQYVYYPPTYFITEINPRYYQISHR